MRMRLRPALPWNCMHATALTCRTAGALYRGCSMQLHSQAPALPHGSMQHPCPAVQMVVGAGGGREGTWLVSACGCSCQYSLHHADNACISSSSAVCSCSCMHWPDGKAASGILIRRIGSGISLPCHNENAFALEDKDLHVPASTGSGHVHTRSTVSVHMCPQSGRWT